MKLRTDTIARVNVGDRPCFFNDLGHFVPYCEAIKAIRKALKLTAEEFGALCHVSARTVEGWEQGRIPRADRLYWIRDRLGRRLDRIQP